ncbi:N-acetyltransferase [Paenibacillus sp. FSL H8-0548]|uniref:GNAT family N-acetyltransferase n=1 Tax=Paenibacillus sp. FSL H8-0548 TaxID=1920422 RepID=UPI00096F89D9|nr:GNAT family protein [Paenibacillus sp. FSL H8-0548]OMF21338.1 N-acetyltransferase [Paenibacillus sp. FSL H8-0548]
MATSFSFQAFPRMETQRFILRKTEERDIPDLFELYSNEEVVRYTPLLPFSKVEEARHELNWHLETFAQQLGIRWMIEEKGTGKVIGTCGFLHYLKEYSLSELGYDLSPSYWRCGIMSEVVVPILDFGFKSLQLRRIDAKVDPENEASIKLLTKLGFVPQGEPKECEFEQGQFIELYLFSLLRKNFFEI